MSNTAPQRPMEMSAMTQNEFAKSRSASTQIISTQKMQEIQAQVILARQLPRDEHDAYNRVMAACRRTTLAEKALYTYPRGDTTVTGPSIRLAEAIAQCWGNINFGIIELERRPGESQAMAYAWDLQTNTRNEKIFTVRHIRDTKRGSYSLKDERDIYEIVANNGARRLRACVLSVLPGDLVEQAIEECRDTMKKCTKKEMTLSEKLEILLSKLLKRHSITVDMVERYIGLDVKNMTEDNLVELRGIYQSLEDGQAKREDFFDLSDKPADTPPEEAPGETVNDGQVLSMSDL